MTKISHTIIKVEVEVTEVQVIEVVMVEVISTRTKRIVIAKRVAVNLTIPIEENGEEVISAATAVAPTAVVLTGVAMLAIPRTL